MNDFAASPGPTRPMSSSAAPDALSGLRDSLDELRGYTEMRLQYALRPEETMKGSLEQIREQAPDSELLLQIAGAARQVRDIRALIERVQL